MIGESNFLVPNGTLIVELIAFVIVLWVLARYFLPFLSQTMTSRQAAITASLQAAEDAKQEASAAEDERRLALEEARNRAREIVDQASRSAEQVRADAAAQAQAEHDRILASAATELDLARQRAFDEATASVGELVLDVVERVIGREIDPAVHADLVDQAIAAVASTDPGSAARATQ
jgi:F-type H+-transporting ATPase subunit b